MTHVISDACISCGNCEENWPKRSYRRGRRTRTLLMQRHALERVELAQTDVRQEPSARNTFAGTYIVQTTKKEMRFYVSLFCSI